jgi:hypothetical protein
MMENVPICKPFRQLAVFQQEIRIMGFPEFGLIHSESLIDENAPFLEGLFDTVDQRPMKIAKYHNPVKGIFRQRIAPLSFQVHLPKRDFCPMVGCRLPCPGQRVEGDIPAADGETFAGKKDPIMPITTGKIQNMAVRLFFFEEDPMIQQ